MLQDENMGETERKRLAKIKRKGEIREKEKIWLKRITIGEVGRAV